MLKIKEKKGRENMTFLKLVLCVLMLCTTLTAAVLIPGKTRVEQAPPTKEYILRYENGQVSLFENGELSQSFEGISFDDLPYVDRQSLKDGIKISSYEEALSLVEDFDG